MWIDSHCHLNHTNIEDAGTVEEIIARAHEARVKGMLTINCRISDEFEQVEKIANENQNVWCTIGTHPHDAADPNEMAITQAEIVKTANSNDKIIGIGETGLDYYYNNSPKEEQQESFRKHLRACIESDLPVIIHTRDAEEDTIRILKEEGAGTGLKGVMHCFSSSQKLAEESLDLGFYISFSGIVTFNKADDLRETVKIVPLNRILVETDSPYLAPKPFRGKTNEPAFVIHTGEMLSGLLDIPLSKMAEQTTANFFTLFDKAKKTWQ